MKSLFIMYKRVAKVILLLIVMLTLSSCKNSNNLEGVWTFKEMHPISNTGKSEAGIAASAWSNLFSEGAEFEFNDGVLTINDSTRYEYDISRNLLMFEIGEEMTFSILNNELELINSELKLTLFRD